MKLFSLVIAAGLVLSFNSSYAEEVDFCWDEHKDKRGHKIFIDMEVTRYNTRFQHVAGMPKYNHDLNFDLSKMPEKFIWSLSKARLSAKHAVLLGEDKEKKKLERIEGIISSHLDHKEIVLLDEDRIFLECMRKVIKSAKGPGAFSASKKEVRKRRGESLGGSGSAQ